MQRRRLAPICLLVLLATLLAPVAAMADPATTAKGPGGGEMLGRATRSAAPTSPAAAAAVPSGFVDNLVFDGLNLPTAIAFAPDGKVFVGEKSGIVKVFDSTSDPTATQVVDLRPRVQDLSLIHI